MTWQNTGKGYQGNGKYAWGINKPYQTRPVITGTKNIDGVKHYTGPQGQLYVAATIDRLFGTTSIK